MPTMRLVGDSVPMLINGVSQQSEVIRLPTQVSEQINCTSSIVQGLTKRPPTEFLKQLDADRDWTNAKVHIISRDENEQYIVVVESGSIRVFDLEGNEHDVDMGLSGSNLAYITLDPSTDTYPTPLTSFRLHTVADTTFLVNRNKTVVMDFESPSPNERPYRALIWIKSVKTNRLHHISVTNPAAGINFSASYKPDADATVNPNHSAQMLARELKNALEEEGLLTNWKVGHYTNIVYIESAVDDFFVSAANDWSDTYISAIKDTVSGVADLPSRGIPGMRIKHTGDVEDSEHGFWVKFLPDSERLQELNTDGFNVVSFDASDISTNTINVGSHPFISRVKTGTASAPSSTTGGERELVQYIEGSFNISGLADGAFYFVDPLVTNGVPNGNIELSITPSDDIDSTNKIEIAGAVKALGSLTGNQVVTHADYVAAQLIRVRPMYGKWVESIAPSGTSNQLLTSFNAGTMPHCLVRSTEIDGEGRYRFHFFTGGQHSSFPLHTWGDRIVGDIDSAPDPTFVDSTINDVFEWRQSLGFASGQNFILSERSQYFNFWPITVATALEDARIDVAASGSNMSNFHSIRVFQDELVGFTNEGQFTLSASGSTLTPESVRLSQTTKYESSETGQPVNIGSSIAFPSSRGGYSAISEYFVREDQMAYVNENTRHVSHYIQGNVINMSVSPVSDSLVVQTDNDPTVLYFYKWYWQGNEKVQSSWSKWTFGSHVISANFVGEVLYLIMQAPTGTTNPELYKIVMTEGDIDAEDSVSAGVGGLYKTALDRRVLFTNHASATISLDYTIEAGTMQVVDSRGRVLTISEQDGSTLTLSEAVDSQDIYVGEVYDSQVEFTRPVMRSRYKENIDLRSRLQVQDYILYHENTGYFKAKVYPRSYTETPYEYEMDNLLGGTTIGSSSISSGSFKVPIRADARDMKLVIHNDSHLPHHLVSAEWSASYNPRIYRQ